ncbi:MAG: hypothetical protein JO274_14825, partial [Gammaproteobacteria bacterium]|nr:hypothetical protein [Gammaproteobacteria bacterium]
MRFRRALASMWLTAAVLCGNCVQAGPSAAPGEGEWTMPSKDFAATRYSTLADINRQNASSLHP